MATNLALWKKSRVLWMKKHDRVSYEYWKKYLEPAIGRSLVRARDAMWLFGSSHIPGRSVHPKVKKAHERIRTDMRRYETMVGASITCDFLCQLARYRCRRLRAYRRGRRA